MDVSDQEIDSFLSNQSDPSIGSNPELNFGSGINNGSIDSFLSELKKEKEAKEFDSPLVAGLAGAARGASFGLSDLALTESGLVSPETLKGLKEYNPVSSTTGELAGVVGPSLLSGGASLLGTAAKGVGSAVKGISAVGAATEAAVLKTFANEAAKTTARKVLEKATATGARAAVEGAFYGTGQLISEYALGDKDLNAQKIMSTIGLSSLLSGVGGAGLSIAGEGIKSAAKQIAPQLKNIGSFLSGVPKDSLDVLKKAPQKIDEVAAMGASQDEALFNYSKEKAASYSPSRLQFGENLSKQIDDALSKIPSSGKGIKQSFDSDLTQKGVRNWQDIFDSARKKIAPDGAALPQIKAALNDIDTVEKGLMDYMKESMNSLSINIGFQDSGAMLRITNADWGDVYLSPRQLNTLKTQLQKSSRYAEKRGVESTTELLYKNLASNANKVFEEAVDPSIRKMNKNFVNLFEAEDSLRSYGFLDKEVDPTKFSKLIYSNDKAFEAAKEGLKTIDGLLGTSYLDDVMVGRAFKDLYAKGGLSKSFTGRAVLIPALAALAASPLGLGGAAASALAGAALQSPAGGRFLAKGAVLAEEVLQPQIDKFISFGGKANQYIPENLVPWISAHVSAMSQLDGKVKKYDSLSKKAIDNIFQSNLKTGPNVPTASSALMPERFDEDSLREAEKMVEKYVGLSDPIKMADLVEKQLGEVSLVAPELGASLGQQVALQANFLANKAPKNPYAPTSAYHKSWRPSDLELAKFTRYVTAVEKPISVLEDIVHDRIPIEGIEVLRGVYPMLYQDLTQKFMDRLSDKPEEFSYQKRLQLSALFGVDFEPTIKPESVRFFQSSFNTNQTPLMGGPGSKNSGKSIQLKLSGSKPSQAQTIEGRYT